MNTKKLQIKFEKKFVKGNITLFEAPYFIYKLENYAIWKNGASLIDTKYCSSKQLLNERKLKNLTIKKGNYIIQRFIDLICAPKEYLINNNYEERYN